MSIKRYTICGSTDGSGYGHEYEYGNWVSYEDHKEDMSELKEAFDLLSQKYELAIEIIKAHPDVN